VNLQGDVIISFEKKDITVNPFLHVNARKVKVLPMVGVA
jgi:hypothetical protein